MRQLPAGIEVVVGFQGKCLGGRRFVWRTGQAGVFFPEVESKLRQWGLYQGREDRMLGNASDQGGRGSRGD